jgi:hypothetical protein
MTPVKGKIGKLPLDRIEIICYNSFVSKKER